MQKGLCLLSDLFLSASISSSSSLLFGLSERVFVVSTWLRKPSAGLNSARWRRRRRIAPRSRLHEALTATPRPPPCLATIARTQWQITHSGAPTLSLSRTLPIVGAQTRSQPVFLQTDRRKPYLQPTLPGQPAPGATSPLLHVSRGLSDSVLSKDTHESELARALFGIPAALLAAKLTANRLKHK